MVGKDLIVMVDFDPAKTLGEYEFTIILIWVRVTKMPLGFMSDENGGIIGDETGEFMEVTRGMMIMWLEVLKVRLDITKPLLRGITLDIEREKTRSLQK